MSWEFFSTIKFCLIWESRKKNTKFISWTKSKTKSSSPSLKKSLCGDRRKVLTMLILIKNTRSNHPRLIVKNSISDRITISKLITLTVFMLVAVNSYGQPDTVGNQLSGYYHALRVGA